LCPFAAVEKPLKVARALAQGGGKRAQQGRANHRPGRGAPLKRPRPTAPPRLTTSADASSGMPLAGSAAIYAAAKTKPSPHGQTQAVARCLPKR
jgi:hypothetical protein